MFLGQDVSIATTGGGMDKKQYYAIKNALSKTEKEIIAYYELCWFVRQGYVPTADEVIEYINNKCKKEGIRFTLKHTALNYYMQRAPVIKALERRGINFRQHTQEELTPTQVAAAVTVCNFADERSTKEKLDSMGLNETQYYAWLNDPAFKNAVAELADRNLKNIRPVAIIELTKKINAGDWQATKFYLETTGAVNNNDTPQSEQHIKMLIEIIQEEVKDPVVMGRIAQRIKLAAQNKTLETVQPRPVIEGQVRPQGNFTSQVNGEVQELENLEREPDQELEYAKKMLGI